MGLLDLFKKKNNTHLAQPIPDVEVPQKRTSDINYTYTKDGMTIIDFYDDEPELAQTYNSTRLVINPTALQIANEDVYDCIVSWYYDNSCHTPSECTPKTVLDGQENILAQIDLQLITIDPEYCYMVMKNLLNKNRVTGFLEDGLKENPIRPCGNYISGIIEDEKTGDYVEDFSNKVGIAVHNSPKMVERRKAYIEQMRKKAASQINRDFVQEPDENIR